MEQTEISFKVYERAPRLSWIGTQFLLPIPAGNGIGTAIPASFPVWPFDEQITFAIFQSAGHER